MAQWFSAVPIAAAAIILALSSGEPKNTPNQPNSHHRSLESLDSSLLLDPRLKDLYQVLENPERRNSTTNPTDFSPSYELVDRFSHPSAHHEDNLLKGDMVDVQFQLQHSGSSPDFERTEKILSTLEDLKVKLTELGDLMTAETTVEQRQAGALGISLDATSVLALLTMGAYLIRVVLTILHVSKRSLSTFQPFEIDAVAPLMGQLLPESALEWLSKSITLNERARSMGDGKQNKLWQKLARLPSELQATWDLSKQERSACLRKFVCKRLSKVPPRKRMLGDDLILWTMSGIAYYNGHPINMFVDEIDNKLTSEEAINCDAMFATHCSEPEYRQGLQKGQLLGKVQTFVARWMST